MIFNPPPTTNPLPPLTDPRLREQIPAGRDGPRVGPAGSALPVHQLHRGPLGVCHPETPRAAPHEGCALLPGHPHGPRWPQRVPRGDKAPGTLRGVDPSGVVIPGGSSLLRGFGLGLSWP